MSSPGRQPRCDVFFVDGDHDYHAPMTDLRNALASASDGATIIADDCTHRFSAVQRAWQVLLREGKIVDAFNQTMNTPPPGGLKGWCVGRYQPRPGLVPP